MNIKPVEASGFTLLEMTVVLMLVGMMSIVIIEGVRFGGRVYAQVARVDEGDWAVFVAQRFLRGVLESAYPFSSERADGAAYALVGAPSRLSFSASASRIQGPGSLNRYELFVGADNAKSHRQNLLVSWKVDRDGRPNPEGQRGMQEVLIENISRIEWNYFDAPCGATGAWRDTWQDRHELPALVRARVVFPPGDPRQWPDLIVAPRVTDEAIFSLYGSGIEDSDCESSR